MLGSELLLKCLEKQGVEIVFGIPGECVIPLYDVLKKAKLSIFLHAMNKERSMLQTAMPVPVVKWVYVFLLPVRGQLT